MDARNTEPTALRPVGFRIPPNLDEELRQVAFDLRRPKSSIVADGIRRELDRLAAANQEGAA